jgi:hypothetical protein
MLRAVTFRAELDSAAPTVTVLRAICYVLCAGGRATKAQVRWLVRNGAREGS